MGSFRQHTFTSFNVMSYGSENQDRKTTWKRNRVRFKAPFLDWSCLSKCQYYSWLKNYFEIHQPFYSLQRYFNKYLISWPGRACTRIRTSSSSVPYKHKDITYGQLSYSKKSMFNFSQVHTAYSTHYTETLWFEHHIVLVICLSRLKQNVC